MKRKQKNKGSVNQMSAKNAANKKATPEKETENKFLGCVKKNKKAIIISATSAVLVIAFVIGLVAVVLSQRDFDYMTSDLSPYLSISKDDYRDFPVEMVKDEIDDGDVERAINKLLYANRKEEALYDGALVLNKPIKVGDTAHIYYRGYTLDEDGNEVELQNGSNLSGDITKLDIGSGTFVEGFEEGLIGIIPKEQVRFEKITSGSVSQGKVAYISGSVILPDGTSKQSFSSERIDFSNPNVEKEWGTGFINYLLGRDNEDGTTNSEKEIGQTLDAATFKLGEGSAVYYDLKVDFVTTCEDSPITVTTKFPMSYSVEELRGETVFFDVYVRGSVVYETPEYNEEFITETLKITAEDLSEYEGDGIVEKHKAKLRTELEEALEEERRTVIEEAMWDHLFEKADLKKLPEYEVRGYYADYYREIESTYQQYSSVYSSMDEFARAYFGLSSDEDWRLYITSMAKNIVSEKLIFYYIIRKENFIPSEEEYNKIYEEQVAEHLTYYTDEIYKEELEEIEDEEKREKRIAEIKQEMLDYYGEEYFRENVHYEYAIDKILAFAKITEK